MSNRDGKTAKHPETTRELWSRRLAGCWPRGKVGKQRTHEKERAAKRKIEHDAKMEKLKCG